MLFFRFVLFTGIAVLGLSGVHAPVLEVSDCTSVSAVADGHRCPDWGFFAHRRINRLAVLTLPPPMMVFFKKHIDWVADHAVDPDMRRYATKQEGPRHFIDLDNYGKPPFADLPRTWPEAMAAYTDIYVVTSANDFVCCADTTSLCRIPDRRLCMICLPNTSCRSSTATRKHWLPILCVIFWVI